ncbi:hypothetical protein CCAN2_1980002 [Capnocytophaga canimorsus]|nr:hypothetical protein CCAN2_1980002 [Capnocytophaga canimorsus]
MAYQKAFENMERHNAWDFETQFKQILSRLKLDNTKLQIKIFLADKKSAWLWLTCSLANPIYLF